MLSVAEGNAELCIEFPECHINVTSAVLAHPEVTGGL